jgi:hypothetical protein
MQENRDIFMPKLLPKMRPYCPHEPMDSEDTLFVLYTSGTHRRAYLDLSCKLLLQDLPGHLREWRTHKQDMLCTQL